MENITPIIGKEFGPKVTPLIHQAKNSIDIIVYNWRWYPNQIGSTIQQFNNAIINAAKKGKQVRVITNFPYINPILSQLNIKTKKINSKKTIHTKMILIDNEIAIIGSHNYTMNAFTINYEVSIIIQNQNFAKRLNEYFNNLWS